MPEGAASPKPRPRPTHTPGSRPAPDAAPPFRWHEHPDFVLNACSRFTVTIATQIQSVSIGWFIYDSTGSAVALGAVGLAAFLPAVALVLVTGYVTDRYDRRIVLAGCCAAMALSALGQVVHVAAGFASMLPLYLTVVLQGAGRAFYLPANMAILPNIVPRAQFSQAIALATAVSQAANISGPAVGGLLYAVSPNLAFAAALSFYAIGSFANVLIRHRSAPVGESSRRLTLQHLFAGFRFIWTKPVILGALTLDLFVVVLGGAVSLLPIFAKDVLAVGPLGLGILRSAPAAGALMMGAVLARRNFMERRAGPRMFTAVLIFGVASAGFGLSGSFALSIFCLAVLGAADTASVVVRMTLVQAESPDALRGRVAAVSSLFTQFSNEIGQFRAGMMAGFFGAVPATVFGGLGAIAVALAWQRWFPALGRRDHLVPPDAPEAKPTTGNRRARRARMSKH